MKYIKKFKTDTECLQSEAYSPTVTYIGSGCNNEDGLCIDSIGRGILTEYKEDNEIISLKGFEGIPLTIEALEDGEISLNKYKSPDPITLKYRINNEGWNEYTMNNSIQLNKGDKLQFKGTNSNFSKDYDNYYKFDVNSQVNIYGNINSLLTEDLSQGVSLTENYFRELFRSCTGIVSAENLKLPATELTKYCYWNMFKGCTSLEEAPELPATELALFCYSSMFEGCTSLIKAPKLPATKLEFCCYECMFQRCTSLVEAPELPAMELAHGCYSFMFQGCTSLVEAPELPAMILDGGLCYARMFEDCTSLNHVKVHFTEWISYIDTNYWLRNVSPSGTFICPSTLPQNRGDNYIPTNWTIKTF